MEQRRPVKKGVNPRLNLLVHLDSLINSLLKFARQERVEQSFLRIISGPPLWGVECGPPCFHGHPEPTLDLNTIFFIFCRETA